MLGNLQAMRAFAAIAGPLRERTAAPTPVSEALAMPLHEA